MDIIGTKIKDLNDIATLSTKSRECLLSHTKQYDVLDAFKLKYKSYFDTVWQSNEIKLYVILNSLNADQLHVFMQIFDNLKDGKGSISCIDACPGTGKTFLTACILMAYSKPAAYMVYTNRLAELMNSVYFDGISVTCCRFLINLLNMNYMKVKNLWNVGNLTVEEKCKNVEKLALDHVPFYPLYIMDEDSVVSPFFIYFMYCLYKYHGTHVIFIGDQYQQIPINATKYHLTSNFKLLEQVAKSYRININMRQNIDQPFVAILRNFLDYYKQKVNFLMTFDVKYFFYDKLKSKFHSAEDFESMYFAQYHMKLKCRLDRYEQYLIDRNVPYEKAFIQAKVNGQLTAKVIDVNIKKFRSYIILAVGNQYIYTPNNYTSFTVTLVDISPSTLKVYNEELKRHFIIRRLPINATFISEQLIIQLQSLQYAGLKQFPIKELISTYHAAQGLTIANSKVELDLDCRNINSFYVGLTRIRELKQLVKIHTQELFNLAYTHNKNDEYFYRIVDFKQKLEDLAFVTCGNTHSFDTSTRNIKIPKTTYIGNSATLVNMESDLMKYINTVR
ncbi:helicase 2 [Homarus gammarus nudivirus]|uniref:Helicase 2 n=1 Tax=Homarus gammarus nudivirus TaxID=2509616 RepID=A0A411HB78_9VIRU|nr:helicase 2 [Homarus gammarus nudivirus]QBB28671.1 helicase 2 [Homarus gammarus nudivirus]